MLVLLVFVLFAACCCANCFGCRVLFVCGVLCLLLCLFVFGCVRRVCVDVCVVLRLFWLCLFLLFHVVVRAACWLPLFWLCVVMCLVLCLCVVVALF